MPDAPLHSPISFHGRVETAAITSRVLADNPLGDPSAREVPVWLPPDLAPDERLPVCFVLAGFTGRGQSYLETHPWKRSVASLYDEACAAGDAPRAILVFPDCFTALGGSQYVNSSATGRYEDHVVQELVPWVDERYPTLPGRRAVCGKSSGGFGAMHLSMRHPEVFPAAGSISGDCGFDFVFAAELLQAARGLLARAQTPAEFLAAFRADPELSGDAHAVINSIAMSACYSPAPETELGFELPVDLATGERIDAVWERWLEFDPLHAVEVHADGWRSLEHLHLECGTSDEFHLQFGLRRLVRRLGELGIEHHHEEFEGGHFKIDERYLVVIPRLIEALSRA